MDEKGTIKELEAQARNTKHLLDKLNHAAYGMTHEELIRLLGGGKPQEDSHEKQG